MKLHENQLNLILHLIRLNIMTYEDCLKFLDTESTGDMIAMSYVFRPLTKNSYVSKSKGGIVTVLQKGRDLFPEEGPLISVASRGKSRLRVLHVSRVCMWMEKNGKFLDCYGIFISPFCGIPGRQLAVVQPEVL